MRSFWKGGRSKEADLTVRVDLEVLVEEGRLQLGKTPLQEEVRELLVLYLWNG